MSVNSTTKAIKGNKGTKRKWGNNNETSVTSGFDVDIECLALPHSPAQIN